MTATEQEQEATRQLASQPAPNIMGQDRMQITERHFEVTHYSNGHHVQVYVRHSDWETF